MDNIINSTISNTAHRFIEENNHIGLHSAHTEMNSTDINYNDIVFFVLPFCAMLFICVIIIGFCWKSNTNIEENTINPMKYHNRSLKASLLINDITGDIYLIPSGNTNIEYTNENTNNDMDECVAIDLES
eukprot:124147_1